ncbi:HD domain-containing phosphohydrolase (plasmid) [Pseudoalteromonas sp. T1lg65]|uniref:HD domain-containing phosphohydrolase n=1 Tax=Pseudoalteromonas sp. T1lg65 TaxID=2077101 RepID=UPI003F79FF88
MMNHRISQNILIVDDEPTNLKLAEKVLSEYGYSNVTLISDPRQVMPFYRARRPSLILLDINMPHLSGFEVMEQLFKLDDPLTPPVIVLTAQDSDEALYKALELGARDFVTKPFNIHELMLRVRNLLDAHMAHKLMYDQKHTLEKLVQQRTKELEDTRLEVAQRLGRAAEYRDEETGNHVIRMSNICALIARQYGWSEQNCTLILHASTMHDLGKIGIPDSILLKKGRLSPGERALMKTHTEIGAELLSDSNSQLIVMAKEIALTHHEKWDGTGYPRGLQGDEIPLSGRITAIADVFDALTSVRPYKDKWPFEDAVNYIQEQKGVHFDPVLVEAFMAVLPEVQEIIEEYREH